MVEVVAIGVGARETLGKGGIESGGAKDEVGEEGRERVGEAVGEVVSIHESLFLEVAEGEVGEGGRKKEEGLLEKIAKREVSEGRRERAG